MKDYSLYEKVKEVLNANSEKEAEHLLYGNNNININTSEYYQRIITVFTKKKEEVICKNNGTLYFDVSKYKNELSNIVFLGYKLLESSSKDNFDIKKFDESLKEVELLNIENKSINYDSLIELKKAIRIIQKFKDSLKHNSEESYKFEQLRDKCNIIIKNLSGAFPLETSINIDYIEEFNSGLILPFKEDIELSKKSNQVAYSILEALDYDPKKLSSFFYYANPQTLSYLLDLVSNDTEKLYRIPYFVFMFKIDSVKKLLSVLDMDSLYKIDSWFTIREENIDLLLTLVKEYGKEEVLKLPAFAFDYFEETRNLCSKYGIEKINKLPEVFFLKYNISEMDRLLNTNSIDDILRIPVDSFIFNGTTLNFDLVSKLIREYGIETVEVLPRGSFENYEDTKKMLDNYTKEEIKKIPPQAAIIFGNNFIKIINKFGLNNIIDFTNNLINNYLPNNLKHYDIIDYEYPSINYQRFIAYNKFEEKYGDSLIELLSEKELRSYNDIKRIIEDYGYNETFFYKVPFFNFDEYTKLIQKYGEDKISKLPIYLQDDFEIVDKYINKIDIKILNQLPKEIFDPRLNIDIIDFLKEYGIEVVKNLPEFINVKKENVNILLKRVNNNPDRLSEFPREFFGCDIRILDSMLTQYDNNISKSIFGINNPKIIALLIYMDNVLSKYDYKKVKENNSVNKLSNIDVSLLKDNNVLKIVEDNTIEENKKFRIKIDNYYKKNDYEKMKYLPIVNKCLYPNYHEIIKTEIGNYLNDDIFRHLRNSISHFRYKITNDNTIIIYDNNKLGDLVFEKEFNINELFELVHNIEKFLNDDLEYKNLFEIAANLKTDVVNKTAISELLHIMSINKELNLNNEKEKSVKM